MKHPNSLTTINLQRTFHDRDMVFSPRSRLPALFRIVITTLPFKITKRPMSTPDHQTIRELLENALQQVVGTQSQVTVFENQLREIKSQLDLSLQSIDAVLKEIEVGEQKVEKVRNDVAATLGEMFEHMSQIVNGARDRMLQQQDDDPQAQSPAEESPEIDAIPTGQSDPEPSTGESLNGNEAGQRAAESLDEMMSTIDEVNSDDINSRQKDAGEAVAQEPPMTAPQTAQNVQPQEESSQEEKPKSPGSSDSLSAVLAKARAASGENVEGPIELTPLDGEGEDTQAVNELLQNTSGSITTQ